MIGFAAGVWELVAVAWVAVAVGIAIGWALRSSSTSGHGGMLDLTPAAADGSLGMDWSDPRVKQVGLIEFDPQDVREAAAKIRDELRLEDLDRAISEQEEKLTREFRERLGRDDIHVEFDRSPIIPLSTPG